MSNRTDLILWNGIQTIDMPTDCSDISKLAEFAIQLSPREQKQIANAFSTGSYEMATSFLWGRAMASLKRELGTLGVTFLAELLGRSDIDENDNVLDVLSEKETIKLAGELGIVNPTDAMRLRHSQEMVAHFLQRDSSTDDEPMMLTDAQSILVHCIRNVLAKGNVQFAEDFLNFRKQLETATLESNSQECVRLIDSPYFFKRLAIVVLLSGIRQYSGAKLERCLTNINVVLPILWTELKETERWQVGKIYAEVYADGLTLQTSGLKQVLLKVRGFDYVPETLRSHTFLKAADAIIRAHEGINNFYTEESPTRELEKLGTVIPPHAFGRCMTALLCVCLGNFYSTCWAAQRIAYPMLKKVSVEKWAYYFDKILPGDTRILHKLNDQKPRENWIALIGSIEGLDVKENPTVKALIKASIEKNETLVKSKVEQLLGDYYKKK